MDRPVVHQEQVGDPAQPFERVAVLVGNRLVREVGAGHDQNGRITGRQAAVGQQQMMKRRVRKHHAELRSAGGDGAGDGRATPAGGENDRPLRRLERRLLLLAELDQPERGLDAGHHQGKRLVLPVLARAQPRHRLLVAGIAGEVKPADALDRDDQPVGQPSRRTVDGVDRARYSGPLSTRADEPHPRAAPGAGVGLGVKATIGRVVILPPAFVAHLEARHRRGRPVVGDAGDDREPRPAVGAVDERVAVPAIRGVEQLRQALPAGGRVGGHRSVGRAAPRADHDPEAGFAERGHRLGPDALDLGQRRRFPLDASHEALHRVGLALNFEQDAVLVVEHVAGQPLLVREPVGEGAKTHTLDRALDTGPGAHARARGEADRARQAFSTASPTAISRIRWYAVACASWIRGMCWEGVITT